MTRSVRIAALQLRAHDRSDFARAGESIVAAVAEASTGAELVVLPEATFPSYVLGHNRRNGDEAEVDATVERLCNLARETSTVIVAGVALRDGNALHNAALAIDRNGSIAGRADKLFLWHFDRRWFEPGEHLMPVRTAVGALGMLVCADGRLPTIGRTLVDRGAELLVIPTAWVTSGRNSALLENVQADLLGRVRAYENGVPFVAANKWGAELEMVLYCGKSQIIGSDGEPIAIAGERESATLKATVEIGGSQPTRIALGDVRPRATVVEGPFRVGISYERLPADVDEKLEVLDDGYVVAPGEDDRLSALDRVLPTVGVEDAVACDPGGLVAYRRAGYRAFVWNANVAMPWSERLARARALELRMYGIVLDNQNRRAYAVDPDGAVVAGTMDGFRLASFSLDPRKTLETLVAPGTDIVEGLERVAAISRREGARTR